MPGRRWPARPRAPSFTGSGPTRLQSGTLRASYGPAAGPCRCARHTEPPTISQPPPALLFANKHVVYTPPRSRRSLMFASSRSVRLLVGLVVAVCAAGAVPAAQRGGGPAGPTFTTGL